MSPKFISGTPMSIFRTIRNFLFGNLNTLPQEDLNYVSSAKAALLQQSPKGGQLLLWLVFVVFISLIIWAAFAQVDEFARGEGKVVPSQQIQIVQNLEGGILAELYVTEGMRVHRGQRLLRIDDTRFSSELREAGLTLAQLEIKSMRLRAEAEGKDFVLPPNHKFDELLAQQEMELYRSRIDELQSNRDVLEEQTIQKQQEISELKSKHDQLSTSYDLLNKELELTRPLADEGAISKVELLRLERQLNDLQGELNAARLALPRVQSNLKEAQEKLANLDVVFKREAREEINKINLEFSRLTQTNQALADRVKRTNVTSPVEGTVKQLLVKTIGGVIQPGMDIIEIVPSEDVLLVEARIKPADIGFLHPGQTAKVKFTAYDFSIMGGLDGELVHISPDTILDDKGNSFYVVKVETSRVFRGQNGAELPIIPGMTVTVDILTGKKSILDYILKPILKTRQLALRER